MIAARPFLLFRDGDGRQRIFNLEPADSITVGRRFEADISLPWDPEASRLHAEFSFRAGEWTICDDGWSQNGTWVNGLRLAAAAGWPTATWSRSGARSSASTSRAASDRGRRWSRAS